MALGTTLAASVWLVFAASDTSYPRMRHLCFIAGAACDDSFGSCVYQTLRKGRFFNANGYNSNVGHQSELMLPMWGAAYRLGVSPSTIVLQNDLELTAWTREVVDALFPGVAYRKGAVRSCGNLGVFPQLKGVDATCCVDTVSVRPGRLYFGGTPDTPATAAHEAFRRRLYDHCGRGDPADGFRARHAVVVKRHSGDNVAAEDEMRLRERFQAHGWSFEVRTTSAETNTICAQIGLWTGLAFALTTFGQHEAASVLAPPGAYLVEVVQDVGFVDVEPGTMYHAAARDADYNHVVLVDRTARGSGAAIRVAAPIRIDFETLDVDHIVATLDARRVANKTRHHS